jgi:hypothetical protein
MEELFLSNGAVFPPFLRRGKRCETSKLPRLIKISQELTFYALSLQTATRTHIHCIQDQERVAARDKVGHQLIRTLLVRFKGGPPDRHAREKKVAFAEQWLARRRCRAGAGANGGSDSGRSPHREAAGMEEMTFVVE